MEVMAKREADDCNQGIQLHNCLCNRIRSNSKNTNLKKTLETREAWNFLEISNLQLKNNHSQTSSENKTIFIVKGVGKMTYLELLPPTCLQFNTGLNPYRLSTFGQHIPLFLCEHP